MVGGSIRWRRLVGVGRRWEHDGDGYPGVLDAVTEKTGRVHFVLKDRK